MQSYNNYSNDSLLNMVRRRGLISEAGLLEREDLINALVSLDNAIEFQEYEYLTYGQMIEIAIVRGFEPTLLPSSGTMRDISSLITMLGSYDDRRVDEMLLTLEGNFRYTYANSYNIVQST